MTWSGTDVDRYEEEVYYVDSDKEGLLIELGVNDIFKSANNQTFFFKMDRDLLTDVKDSSPAFNFSFYPNPASNFINIKTLGLPYSLELYDYSGRKLIEQSEIYEMDYKLDVREFPSGLYSLKVKTKGEIQNKKLIITK